MVSLTLPVASVGPGFHPKGQFSSEKDAHVCLSESISSAALLGPAVNYVPETIFLFIAIEERLFLQGFLYYYDY